MSIPRWQRYQNYLTDFQVVIIKIGQWAIMSMLETNEKKKNSSGKK